MKSKKQSDSGCKVSEKAGWGTGGIQRTDGDCAPDMEEDWVLSEERLE